MLDFHSAYIQENALLTLNHRYVTSTAWNETFTFVQFYNELPQIRFLVVYLNRIFQDRQFFFLNRAFR